MGNTRSKRHGKSRIQFSHIALAILALCTAGVVAFAFQPVKGPEPTTIAQRPVPTPTPTKPRPPVVAFLGDSFTAGNNDTPGEAKNSYMKRATETLGMASYNFALGGTGYVNPGANESVPFGKQVWRVVNVAPDLVIVGGGINDAKYPAADIGAAAAALYDDLHTKFPKATVVAVGPITPGGVSQHKTSAPVRDVLKATAEAHGVTFIDPIAEDWMPTKEGVTDSSKFHPNAAGQELLAGKLTTSLQALGIPGKLQP